MLPSIRALFPNMEVVNSIGTIGSGKYRKAQNTFKNDSMHVILDAT